MDQPSSASKWPIASLSTRLMATSLRNLIRPDSLAREYVKSRGSRSKSRKEAEKGFMPSQCLGARGLARHGATCRAFTRARRRVM
jgi:hypothetical protein